MFLFISLAVSIGLQMILPFPYGLVAALAIFIIFPLFLRKRYMNKIRDGNNFGSNFFGLNQNKQIRYVCLTCNNKFKGGECPRCGSKMKRADF